MSKQLSIVIPFANEHPMIMFTIQSVLEEIKDLDAELIVIDNYCSELEKQTVGEEFCPGCMQDIKIFRTRDKGGSEIQKKVNRNPKLKYISYPDKLSHWCAKNKGVLSSEGLFLLFLDAHVIPSTGSIKAMYEYYNTHYEELNGSIHLPLAYMLDNNILTYRLETNPAKGFYHYQFAGYRNEPKPYKVPVMSSCGMMISRELFDLYGGWPTEYGIYGGGENYVNFVMAILGKDKHIMNTGPLYHYADKRGYYYNYDDFIRNRTIAVYMVAGEEAAHLFVKNCQGNQNILENICRDVVSKTADHKKLIESRQQMTIGEWLEKMKIEGLWDGVLSTKEYVS